MEYRQLGRSGVRASVIGLGTNRFGTVVDQAGVNNIISAALDAGLNFIDTADVYGKGKSEEALGIALEGTRDQVLLATKAFHEMGDGPNDRGTSRVHLLNAVEDSLRRLRTDYIDLYQMHRWDSTTPIEETLRTLDALVRSGKVRYIGASQYASWQLAKANLLAEFHHWEPFITEQSHYHMLERGLEREVIPYCAEHGIGLIPYFPLAGGFLTGKYKRGQPAPAGSRGESSEYVQGYRTPENYTIVEALEAWAQARDHTMGELAHAWLLANPVVSSVISGVTKVEQVQANVKAGEWSLTADELAEVNAILKPPQE
jgi:aryl-alcohol dehydrogenase-like predicted oxidoreductase